MDLVAYLIETVDTPAHVGSLQIFQPVAEDRAATVERILKGFRESEVGPPFNYYPVFPRFGMPQWAQAEEFEVDYHVRHAAVPSPGTDRQLIDMVMDLHAGIMDRSRPGWIAYVIEGLEDGCFAVYWKVHHAYIDGASAILRMDAAMSRSADDLEVRPLWGRLFEPSRGARDLPIRKLLEHAGKGLGAQARAAGDITRAIARMARQASGQLKRESPLPFSAPRTLFNKPVHATRNLGVGSASVDRFKAISKSEQASINEVALTTVGVALDRYRRERGETPSTQMVATCPLAVREEGDTDASTQIAAISIKLGDSKLPVRERLQQVHVSSRDAKEEASEMSREALMNYLVLVGGAATLFASTPLADYVPPLSSVNVSNVAGPQYRCFMGGAEMVRSYPVSTLAGGTAINITFTSFGGLMTFAVIADSQAVPDAQKIADYMSEALEELEATLAPRRKTATRKRKAGAKATARKAGVKAKTRKSSARATPRKSTAKAKARKATAKATARKSSAGRKSTRKSATGRKSR
jgi:diacylglycerol O-acyltransferase